MLVDNPPQSQTVTTSRTPPPSSVTYFMDGPLATFLYAAKLIVVMVSVYYLF